ncbi:MAG: GNAT family N-acetyltransferase [Elusimicrobiota bacterium]
MDKDKITYRRYKKSDCDAVGELHLAALQSAGVLVSRGPWDDDLNDIEGIYINNQGEFIIAELEGVIIGMGAIRQVSEGIAEVKRMRVEPGFQGKGIGSQILIMLEKRAKELDYKELQLDTSSKLHRTQKFYTERGYVEFDRQTKGDHDLVFFKKRI